MSANGARHALNEALKYAEPACNGRSLFTADRLTDDQRALCAYICAGCPVFDLCDAYATAANPEVGFWAGHVYPDRL